MDRGMKSIAWFVWIGVATEMLAKYCARNYISNVAVYNIYCLVEWVLFNLYFYYSVTAFQRKGYVIWIALFGLIAGIVNLLIFQPISKMNSNFMFIACIGVCCMSLFAIYKLIESGDSHLQLHQHVHFWIPVILIFYQCVGLWSWVAYNYYVQTDWSVLTRLRILYILNSIIMYSALGAVLLQYPKMEKKLCQKGRL
jgi:hypothetical protein